jgi:hypothetical protein
MRGECGLARKTSVAPWAAALIALVATGCDARSYDAACGSNQTSSSVESNPCDESELGQIACALPSADTCTPLSPAVVECKHAPDAGSGGAPSWQGVFSCQNSQICYFFQPVDGALAPSNAVGCGVNNFPLTQSGLPCANEKSLACSFDTTTVLECDGGVWTASEHCGSKVCGGVACTTSAPYCVGCQ